MGEYIRRVWIEYTSETECVGTCQCPFCGVVYSMELPVAGVQHIKKTNDVNQSGMTPSQREMFITGICDDCFPSDPEEDEEDY